MTRRIRLLVLMDSLQVGGAEMLLPIFLRHIDHRLFDVHVCAIRAIEPTPIHEQVRRHAGSLIEWPQRRLFSVSRIRQLAALLRDGEFDLVYSHLVYPNVQAAIAGRLAGCPSVATLHGIYPLDRGIRSRLLRSVEVGVLRAIGTPVIAVAESVKQAHTGRFGLSDRQVSVIPNAIDLGRFTEPDADEVSALRVELLADKTGPLVIAVGRRVPAKGYPDLARAVALLRDRLPGLRVVIAGRSGDDDQPIEREIARLDLGDSLCLLGQRDDIPQLLAAADIFALSSHYEGVPLAMLEAMAANIPIVATRVGGVPEVIRDGTNGLLLRPGDPTALAAAIGRVADDPALARCLARRGRETVEALGAEQWARRLEAEFLGILGDRSRRDAREGGDGMQPVVAAAPMDLRGRLTRLRQDPALPPEASIVIPVDAARDLENVLRIVGDISHYAGGHSLEVLLVVNNYHPGQVPAIVAAYRRLGLRVVCVPDVRRPGEPPGFTGRFLGLRHLASDIGILFDADCRVPDATALLDWYIAQFAAGADVAYTHVGFHSYRAIPSIRAQIVTHHTARWVKREVLRRPTTRGSNYAVRRDVALQRYDEGYLADEMNVGPTIKALGGKVGYSGARDLIVLTSGRMFVGGWRHLARYLIYRLGYNARVLPVRRGVARYTRIGADSRPATVDAVGADQEQGPSLAPPGSDGMNRGERAPAAGALGSLAGKERRTLA